MIKILKVNKINISEKGIGLLVEEPSNNNVIIFSENKEPIKTNYYKNNSECFISIPELSQQEVTAIYELYLEYIPNNVDSDTSILSIMDYA